MVMELDSHSPYNSKEKGRQNPTRIPTMWCFNLAISEILSDKIGPGQLHPSEIWQP